MGYDPVPETPDQRIEQSIQQSIAETREAEAIGNV